MVLYPEPKYEYNPRDFPATPLIPLPKFAYEGYLKDFTNPKSKNEAKTIFNDASRWSEMIKRNNATSEIDLTAEVCFNIIEDGECTETILRSVISRIQTLMQVKGAERTGIAALVNIAQTSEVSTIMRTVAYAIASVFDEGDNRRWFDELVLEELEVLMKSYDDDFEVVWSRLE